ncbi:hypothetical protein [Flavobacterium pectinovorum]|uniref:Uncharacterized protein n=1 Tax=Flavobacterium pectinovorum TaxID=29533 RepID=A0AB36P792_9FLAO|nr:hypothetical protein [Flavobacterium pectinovorum]OXB07788.1 hypothetical protein B0A72_02675 [Flavobacterium pectinovorum]SHM80550.1 hypothetical protein SAMN05444387_3240 [Flavobacterium pectinovorum]
MIEINDFLENNLSAIKNIIAEFEIEIEFSSHDFIEKFTDKYESDYIKMLVKYQESGHSFKTVHNQIALFLSAKKESLGIYKTQRKGSENVKGKIDIIQWWIRSKPIT